METEGESLVDDEKEFCTEEKCTKVDIQHVLTCFDCKRHVHYRCTKLPTYQLECFITKKGRRFSCINCVEIRDEFLKSMSEGDPNQSFEVEELTQALKDISLESNKAKCDNEALRE